MPRKKIKGFSQPMTSMDYFFSDITEQRSPVKAAHRRVTMETALRQNNSTTLILVKSGTGTIYVNSDEYELRRGVLMAISDYQAYKFKPQPGQTLEYVECQFDYMTYLFFMANPYFHFTSPGLGPCAVYAVLEGENLETAKRLSDYLVISHSKGKHGERETLQIMELFGLLIKYSDAEGSYPVPLPDKYDSDDSGAPLE